MKRSVALLLIIATFVAILCSCEIGTATKYEVDDLFPVDEEEEEVRRFVNENAQTNYGTAFIPSEIKDIYFVRFLNSFADGLIEKFDQEKSLHKLIDEKNEWVVVMASEQVLKVVKENDQYSFGPLRVEKPSTGYDYLIDKELVVERINEKKMKNVSDQVIISDGFFPGLSYVIFYNNGTEYYIPFCARPDFSKLENGKIYTSKEAISTLSEWYLSYHNN